MSPDAPYHCRHRLRSQLSGGCTFSVPHFHPQLGHYLVHFISNAEEEAAMQHEVLSFLCLCGGGWSGQYNRQPCCAPAIAYCCSALQYKYDKIKPYSTTMPANLYNDLVRITQLARVGQIDLYDAIKACCAGKGGSETPALGSFISQINNLAKKAPIKYAAIQNTLGLSSGAGEWVAALGGECCQFSCSSQSSCT